MKILLLWLISFYRRYKKIFFPPSTCIYFPSCSEYWFFALKKYSFKKAFFLGMKRLLRCHPFRKGGYDPLI